MIGRTLSNDQILEKIGEGGMGEVYPAKDTKLERDKRRRTDSNGDRPRPHLV